MKERVLPGGLNHYGNSADAKTKIFMADEAEVRLKRKFENADREIIGNNILAECESVWDDPEGSACGSSPQPLPGLP